MATRRQRTRHRDILGVGDWTVADLGPGICACVFWRGSTVRVIVSDRVRVEHECLVALHALSHQHDQPVETWGETTGWCEVAHCWAAQSWLPGCMTDVRELAAPA